MEAVEPILVDLDRVHTREDMEALLDDFVVQMHEFIEQNFNFVRLTLYRMLEDSADVISIEEELQAVAISRIDGKFRALVDRGVIHAVDTKALVVFLVSTLTTWHVTGRVKAHWLGAPGLDTPAGRARSEAFFIDMLSQYLI